MSSLVQSLPIRPSSLIHVPSESGPRCRIYSKDLLRRVSRAFLALIFACRVGEADRVTTQEMPHIFSIKICDHQARYTCREATVTLQHKKNRQALQRIERTKHSHIRKHDNVTRVGVLIARSHRRKEQTEQIISRQRRLRHRNNIKVKTEV